MNILNHISLKPYNTFGVEAQTRYFTEVESLEQLVEALKVVRNQDFKIPLLVLGGGSNILLTKDFEGLTIKLNLKGISEEKEEDGTVLVTAKAGENWHNFVLHCLDKNYGGLENLSLIPGNVGTSPMQNIGAYGVEIKDVFYSCKALNLETLEIEVFDREKSCFGYRESFFKREGRDKYIIVEVSFRLTTSSHTIKTEYGAIQTELEKMNKVDPSIQDVSQAVIAIRKSKLPDPKVLGNAGSFFKNPTISKEEFLKVQMRFPEIPFYSMGEEVKIPAGWLIEQTGWKGVQIGNVATHSLQALVIVNATGQAEGNEIYEFSEKIIRSVKDQFGIELEREVNVI